MKTAESSQKGPPYVLANQKLNYLQLSKIWRQIQRIFFRIVSDYEPGMKEKLNSVKLI